MCLSHIFKVCWINFKMQVVKLFAALWSQQFWHKRFSTNGKKNIFYKAFYIQPFIQWMHQGPVPSGFVSKLKITFWKSKMGTAAVLWFTCCISWRNRNTGQKGSRLHKDLHCNYCKRETTADKRKTEWQSTATTQKTGDSSLRPPLFSCVPPPLHTTPPKPNQCLSVHLSTWSAQMDQEIERRLKGEYREK